MKKLLKNVALRGWHIAERVGDGSDYGSFGIVECHRAGFSTSPGVHAWVGKVALILEPHFMGLSLMPSGKTLAKAFIPKPPEGGL